MNEEKPQILYPCEWDLKLVGSSEMAIRKAIDDIVIDRSCQVSHSKKSKTGKYTSLNLRLTVLSEQERDEFYKQFSAHEDINFVL